MMTYLLPSSVSSSPYDSSSSGVVRQCSSTSAFVQTWWSPRQMHRTHTESSRSSSAVSIVIRNPHKHSPMTRLDSHQALLLRHPVPVGPLAVGSEHRLLRRNT